MILVLRTSVLRDYRPKGGPWFQLTRSSGDVSRENQVADLPRALCTQCKAGGLLVLKL